MIILVPNKWTGWRLIIFNGWTGSLNYGSLKKTYVYNLKEFQIKILSQN